MSHPDPNVMGSNALVTHIYINMNNERMKFPQSNMFSKDAAYPSVNNVVHYVSAPCSSGKTYATSEYICAHLCESNFLYAAPSIDLLNETCNTLTQVGVNPTLITCITSLSHPNNTKAEIVSYLKGAGGVGNVLLITQQAYLELPYFHRKERWQIFIDELPQVDALHKFELPKHYKIIGEHVTDADWVNDTIALVKPKDKHNLRRLLEQPRDQVFEAFRPLFTHLLSENRDVFAGRHTLDRLEGKGFSKSNSTNNMLYFLSMLNAKPFENAVVLGANVEDSMLYEWLKRYHGRKLEVEHKITNKLRSVLPPGERLRIRYFLTSRFSKGIRNKASKVDDLSVISAMDIKAQEHFCGQLYLFATNNDRADSEVPTNAMRISPSCRGLNQYSNLHNIYFSAALNRETKHIQMLEQLGLDSDFCQKATAHEVMYQTVLRTSLRDPASPSIVTAILPDKPSAETVAKLTGCNDVAQLCALMEERQKPLTRSQKRSRAIARKHMEQLFAPKLTPESLMKKNGVKNGVNLDCIPDWSNPSPIIVTFHKTPYAFHAHEFVEKAYDVQEFIQEFRQLSNAIVDKKNERWVFNSSIFRPNGQAEGYRRQEHFYQSSFMALDFDNGTLSAKEFERIFGQKPKRSFLLFNSFNRSPEMPNKFRVILFYKQPARSVAEHQAIFNSIEMRLESDGYPPTESGLDRNCRSGIQSFWVPCTNRAHQDWHFFKACGTKTREIETYAIDPSSYLKTALVELDQEPTIAIAEHDGSITREQIDRATEYIRTKTAGRHAEYWNAGLRLKGLGLPDYRIEQELMAIAGSEQHLKKKVKGVMVGLCKRGYVKKTA